MEREDLLRSRTFWLVKIQSELFQAVDDFREKNKLNRTEFAKKLGVTKGYISQVLNGDFDHRISKLVDLSLAIGKAPYIELRDLDAIIEQDKLSDDGTAVFSKQNISINITNNIYLSSENITNDFVYDTEKPVYVLSNNQLKEVHSDSLS